MIKKEHFMHGWAEIFSFSLACISLLVLFIAPIYYVWLVYRYVKELEKPEDEQEIDSDNADLFDGLRHNGPALRYPLVFTLRRYAIIAILTGGPTLKLIQIFGHFYSTMYVISYLWSRRPYENNKLTVQEVLNEGVVLLAAYPLLVFTPWVQEIEPSIYAGWAIVACIVIIIIGNIAFLVVTVYCQCTKNLKLRYIRYENTREMLEKRVER